MFVSERLVIDTARSHWQPRARQPSVLQKTLYCPNPTDSVVETSLLRYPKGARHAQTAGEEVLVLEGALQDERGTWPQGSLLLQPEREQARSLSSVGCVLLVRRGQYKGAKRERVALNTASLPWETCSLTGAERKCVYAQSGYPDWQELQSWPSCCEPGLRVYQSGAELYVLSGELEDEQGRYGPGCWLRFSPGAGHRPFTRTGCEFLIKQGVSANLCR